MEKSYSQALHIAIQLIRAEDQPDLEALKKLEWIENHTTQKIDANFHVVMSYVSRNLTKPLNREVEIKTNNGYKEFEIRELIIEINKAYREIFSIVMNIAKKYSVDVVIKQKGEVLIPEIS